MSDERLDQIRARLADNYRVFPGKSMPVDDVRTLLAALAAATARKDADEARLRALAAWDEARQERIAAQTTWAASRVEEDYFHLLDKTEHEDHMRHWVEKLLDAQRAATARTDTGEEEKQ